MIRRGAGSANLLLLGMRYILLKKYRRKIIPKKRKTLT
jgi:hypothetical protein